MQLRNIHVNSLRTRYLKKREKGFSLLEMLLVLALFALFSIMLINLITDNASRTRAKALADKMTMISEATKGYIKANYAALLAKAPSPGSGALVIPVGKDTVNGAIPTGPSGLKSIQGAGFLPANFIDRNSFNQKTAVLIRGCGCANNTLEVLLTTYDGRKIPDNLLGLTANTMGALGGFVPEKYVVASQQGNVLGSYGGWQTDASDWGPASTQPQTGTIQATLAFEDGSLLSDYLNRYDIDIPEANKMHTNVDVNGNDLDHVKTISAETATGEVGLTGSLRATVDIYARDGQFSRNLSAGNNLAVGNDAAIVGNAAIGKNATVVGTTTTQTLQVNGNATVNNDLDVKGHVLDLKANYINADAIVYKGSTTTFGKTKANAVRLGDLLPKMSGQYSYRVTAANSIVYKPVCNSANPSDFSNARIMLYRQTESFQVVPNVPLTTTTSNGYVQTVIQNKNASWVQIASAIIATDRTTYWEVSWIGDAASSAATRQAIAQTYCYFG
jgi:prepilin-type N-terminal cleavage/methylation domain-containing protein